MKFLRGMHRRLSSALVRDDQDYSIARMTEPLISNRALLSFLVPVVLITILQVLQPFFSANEELQWIGLLVIGWAFALWYILGFLVVIGLVSRWFFLHRAATADNKALAEVAKRLGSALVRSHRNDPDYFEIISWDETITVRRNGDAVIDRTVAVQAGTRPVSMLWSACISFGPRINVEDIKIQAFRKTNRGESPVAFDPTWSEVDGNLRSDLHIYPTGDLSPQATITLRLRWEWPEYAAKTLARDAPEEFSYAFNRKCANFKVKVKTPRGLKTEADFRASSGPAPVVRYEKSSVTVEAAQLGPGRHLNGNIQATK